VKQKTYTEIEKRMGDRGMILCLSIALDRIQTKQYDSAERIVEKLIEIIKET
jgi:hypothetical protein